MNRIDGNFCAWCYGCVVPCDKVKLDIEMNKWIDEHRELLDVLHEEEKKYDKLEPIPKPESSGTCDGSGCPEGECCDSGEDGR